MAFVISVFVFGFWIIFECWEKYQQNPTVTYINVEFLEDEPPTPDLAVFSCPKSYTKDSIIGDLIYS